MYACIDLGSNSFHLLIAQWHNEKSKIVERFSNIVQLGEGVAITGEISPAAFERGVVCLQEFKDVMSKYPIEQYWALGTNALRLANNADDFIAAAHEIGLDISVISGVQEAILVYMGVLSNLPKRDDTRLVVDIGGGSTEIIIGQLERRFVTKSLAIGCVSWRDRYFKGLVDATPTQLEHSLDAATDAASEVFATVQDSFQKYPWVEAFASSGTAKMLAMVCQYRGYREGSISLLALEAMKEDVLRCAADPELLLPGLKDRRKDLLMPGWAVLVGLMRACSLQHIAFSPTALREGMLDFMMHNGTDTSILGKDTLPEVTQTEL
tara:strand:- start:3472 stop:4440 length:969 start_codon:yes stop_codon:yes gene_type:complete